MTSHSSAADVTQERIAQQFGFNTQHWAPSAAACSGIAQPDPIVHQGRPSGGSSPFVPSDPAKLIKREELHPAIADFFVQHKTALALACISQLNETRYLAWSSQARPLLTLFKECSFSPEFGEFVRTTPEGAKLYNAFARGILRLIKDAEWVTNLGIDVKVDDDIKYTNIGAFAQLDVLGCLLVALPALTNIISALADVPPPRGHAKAAEQARTQLRDNMEKLASMDPALLWTADGEATQLGDRVALVYDSLSKVLDTLRM